MADFSNGVLSAPTFQVAPCGLLSVARVETESTRATAREWLRGFAVETDGYPSLVRVENIENTTIPENPLYDGSAKTKHFPAFAYFAELEVKRSGIDFRTTGLNGNLLKQMDGVSQKVAERQLWEGDAVRALSTPGTGYLTEAGKAVDVTSGATAPDKALMLLEQEISNSPTGGRGVIHMTRDVASILGSRLLYKSKSQDGEDDYAVTRLGTLVVIGSGYTGNGPIGATGAAASATNKWMFATGGVEVLLGAADIVNDDLSQGFDTSTNDSTVRVLRPIAAHFDPTIWAAAQVTLP